VLSLLFSFPSFTVSDGHQTIVSPVTHLRLCPGGNLYPFPPSRFSLFFHLPTFSSPKHFSGALLPVSGESGFLFSWACRLFDHTPFSPVFYASLSSGAGPFVLSFSQRFFFFFFLGSHLLDQYPPLQHQRVSTAPLGLCPTVSPR